VQATLDALRRHPGLPDDRRAAMLGDAAAEQRRMVDLLDGLQALARGDAPAAERSDVDLADVVDAAVVAASARHPDVRVDATFPDAPVTVRGWEPGLRLMVDNLVGNAALHGGGGRVHVTLAPGPVLTIDDDGAGVPEAERARVFEPFVRIDGAGPGSGLGLAIVAQQARHHGATVTVGDAPLGGARFTVAF
jgi:signal transduction histidine kinase